MYTIIVGDKYFPFGIKNTYTSFISVDIQFKLGEHLGYCK